MDWLKSALNSDGDDSDEERVVVPPSKEADFPSRQPRTTDYDGVDDEDTDSRCDSQVLDDSNESRVCLGDIRWEQEPKTEPAPPSLFTLSTASRRAEDYTKDETVEIRPLQPDEDCVYEEENCESSIEAASHNHDTPAPVKVQGNLDTSDIMQCFNMIHSGGNIKAPKQRDWFGSNIRVIDINADSLRQDRIEKSKQYSMSKAALLEGRPTYKGPTRVLQTDDGQLLATNVLRKTSKRKHQISWLAAEAQERELKLLERTAQARKTKHETQMKYGW